jgi:hypothetical protein
MKVGKKVVQCKFRYLTELIGFEGEFKFACACKKHPEAINYFAECCKEKCPKGNYNGYV